MAGPRRVDQVFHAQQSISTGTPGWVLGTNEGDRLLGIRIVAPSEFGTDTGTQQSTDFYSHDSDGRYAYVRVHATTNSSSATFLEVLWPTTGAGWTARPNIQPLDSGRPEMGVSVPLGVATERWVYAAGAPTSAGGLTLNGPSIGIARVDATGNLQRVALEGNGTLADAAHTLLATPAYGVVEISMSATVAEVSGTLADGVSFYGPSITQVMVNGQVTQFSRGDDGTITVGATSSPGTVVMTAPVAQSSVSGIITLAATASSPDGVAGVQFLADGQPVGPEDTTVPYSTSLDTAGLSDGAHTFAARGRSNSGVTTTSSPVAVTVSKSGGGCLSSTAGQAWASTPFPSQNGQFTATVQMMASDATTVGGVGLGRGAGKVWTDLAAIVTFSDDGTVVARDGDHYVSSGMRWAANQTYLVRFVVDIGTHTYAAYVRAPGASTDTRIGTTLAFRTEQQAVAVLDTLTVPAGIGSVRACGLMRA